MYGRISTYISYVAAPFHPFGGAVDIIVVRQQDGSFKSTPWYVRFGKFQGVLKRNEEIVTVAVNGVEANFHMYLDKTGQAYLLREVESDEEDESSDESEDEAVTASRRESFKSAESRGDIEEQFDDRIGEYGDDEMEADQIRASLNSEALGGISMIHQSNGEILISFAEHSSNLSDKQIGNGLQNCAAESLSVNENGNGKSNGDMAFDSNVKFAVSPKENVKAQQVSSTSHLDGELPNGNEKQNAYGHQESSKIESPFVQIGAVSQTEFGGRVSENGWDSYKETSVFTMEGSSGTLDVPAGNTSSTDAFVVSGYNAYGYEHMNLPQSEDASDFRKVEDGNSEVVLMSVDGHVMRAPISSFKRSGSLNLHGPQLKTVTSQGDQTQYVDQITSLRKVDHSFTDKHGEEITKSNDNPVKVAANDTPESIVRTLYGFSISESLLDSEGQSKRSGQLTDNTHKTEFQAETESHASEPKVDTRQIPRTESEMEFASNDEDVFKSCIALNELSSPTEEEDRQHSLSTHLEEEEEFNEERTHATQKESYSAALQPGKCQASHVESSHPSESMHKSDRQSVGRSMSSSPGNQSKPINIRGPHTKGRGVSGQVTTSLPDMGFLSSSMETSVTQGLSRSLDIDSSFCKRSVNHDTCPAKFENVEAETSDVYKLNGEDSSDKSLQPDVGTDVAISLCGDLLSKGMGAEAAARAFDSKLVSREEFMRSGAEIIKNEKLIVRIRGRFYPWSAVSHVILGRAAFDLEVPLPGEPEGEICVECLETAEAKDNTSDSNFSSSGRWRFWPFRRLKTPEKTTSGRSASNVELSVDQEAGVQNPSDKELEGKNALNNPRQKRKVQTNTPTSEQLASLNLKEGLNMITFTFLTSIWGKQQVDARIHLWKWNTRIVISDVDGTITKSDVLGQVMPLVGKDWTQTGVARLFSAIKDNGYQILFLSARAITQAYLTRQFLLNLKQDGKALPDGPVMISPDGVVPSLYREVIRRAPHEFKIACLEDIRRLFPPECNPFYAGFGNRDTDEISYLKVGIPKGKIFIINPKGEVVVNHRVDVKSYTSLHKLANDMFPPMSSCEREDFNSWNYWKVPLPDIED